LQKFSKEKNERNSKSDSRNLPPLEFLLLDQLGHYSWNPGHNSNDILKSHNEVTVADITARLQQSNDSDDVNALLEGLTL